MAKVRTRSLPDGRILGVREDGSMFTKDPQTGQKTEVSGPDDDIASSFNDTSTLTEQIAATTAWQNSPGGQRANQLYEQAYDQRVREFDEQQGVREQAQGTNQYNAETGRMNQGTNQYNAETGRMNAGTNQFTAETGRYSAETGRMTANANISELERRFGLDVAKFGTDYVKTAIEYAKTPRKWIDSLMWESGATPIYQNIAQGKALPAFGAKGAATGLPGMNSITDTMGTLGFDTSAVAALDPTKALQQIIKAVPPGQSPSGQMNDTEMAVVNLAKSLYQAGGKNVAEGAWESYDKDVQDTLLGAMDFVAPNGGSRYLRQLGTTRMPTKVNVNAA